MSTYRTLTASAVLAATVLLAGACTGGQDPTSTTTPTTAVTAANPAQADYDYLRDIERRHPERFPASFRQDYSWAFDPTTGKLLPLDPAYTRARKMGIVGTVIWASYAEMVGAIRSQPYVGPPSG